MTEGEAVPGIDPVCRFIRPDCWDDDDQRPTPEAFKASDRTLSVFHISRVTSNGDALRSLCFGTLEGAGEAILTADHFRKFAEEVIRIHSPLNFVVPTVVWRPEDVHSDWVKWKDAHANVETSSGKREFPDRYREILAERCTVTQAPTIST